MKLDSEDKECRSFKNLYFPIVYFSFYLCKLFLPHEHDDEVLLCKAASFFHTLFWAAV